MSSEPRSENIAEEVLGGQNRELQLLAAQGLLPLPPGELLSLQVRLASVEDAEVAAAASSSLADFEPRLVANQIAEAGGGELVVYFAARGTHPVVLEAILRLRGVSSEILRQLAVNLPPDLQEILLLRQDAIVDDPAILDHLERNPQASAYTVRRIAEYRDHLLARKGKPEERRAEAAEGPPDEEDATDADVVGAVLDARSQPEEGEQDESTGLSEAQIRTLPIPVKLKLSRGAARTLRNILIRDKNPMVARSVLTGNVLSDSEVEQIANSRAVVEDVLQDISRNRQWMRKYSIMLALVRNPRTNVGTAVRLAPRLAVRDLKNLRRDHNVPEAVRATAARLYRIKGV